MRFIIVATIGAALAAAQTTPLASLLDRLENSRSTVSSSDLDALGGAVSQELAAGSAMSPNQHVMLGRASNYLAGVQSRPGLDPATGLAAAAAWRSIAQSVDARSGRGGLDPGAALLGYRNAYLLMSRFGAADSDLGLVGGRIRALGGAPPIWLSVGAQGTQSRSQEEWGGMPLRPATPPPSGPMAELPPFPRVDPLALSPEAAREYRSVEERYSAVAASVYTARASTEAIRASVQGRGLSLHPDTEQNLVRMDLAMRSALKAIEAQRFKDGRAQLDAAAEYATRLLKLAGR